MFEMFSQCHPYSPVYMQLPLLPVDSQRVEVTGEDSGDEGSNPRLGTETH